MLKTKRVLGFLLYLNVQTFYLKSIHGRGFIRCPDLDNYLRAELPLLDLSLNSRLLCGAMCTEHLYEWCLSYAWSRDSKRCILFQKKCSIDTQRDQTEKGWEHYETQVMWDIAVGKQAQQSSTHPPFVAELAVDGNRSTDIYDNSCSHTNQPQNSWWIYKLYITLSELDCSTVGWTNLDKIYQAGCGMSQSPWDGQNFL